MGYLGLGVELYTFKCILWSTHKHNKTRLCVRLSPACSWETQGLMMADNLLK